MGIPDIAQLKARKDTRGLVKALQEWRSDIRCQAATALDDIGWEPADDGERSLYFLGREDWEGVRANSKLAVEILIKQLDKSGPEGKRQALWFLAEIGEIRDSRAADSLIRALFSAVDFELANKEKMELFKQSWRQEALHAIDRLGQPGMKALQESIRKYTVQGYQPVGGLLGPRYWQIRPAYKEHLVMMGNLATDSLIQLLSEKHTPHDLRFGVSLILGYIGDQRAIKPLTTFLSDTKRHIRDRESAAMALGLIGDSQALEPLLQALKDRSKNFRQNAAAALGHIGDPRALEPLLHSLKDEDPVVRANSASALGDIYLAEASAGRDCDTRVIESIISALREDTESCVKCSAAAALGMTGDPRAMQPLIEALRDKDPSVRAASATALAELGDTSVKVHLEKLLTDDDTLKFGLTTVKDAVSGALRSLDSDDARLGAVVCPRCKSRLRWYSAKLGQIDYCFLCEQRLRYPASPSLKPQFAVRLNLHEDSDDTIPAPVMGKQEDEPRQLEESSHIVSKGNTPRPNDILSLYSTRLKHPQMYFSPNIPQRKLRNAVQTYAPTKTDEEPLALVDDTVWGSAKEGMLLTDWGVYAQVHNAEPSAFSYQQLRDISLKDESSWHNILVNGVIVWRGTWVNKAFTTHLFEFLNELKNHCAGSP